MSSYFMGIMFIMKKQKQHINKTIYSPVFFLVDMNIILILVVVVTSPPLVVDA